MSDFLEKLDAALTAHSPRRRYLVGVSGGRDSVALLHGLLSLGFKNLVVCHLDHGLRGAASKADARFVKQLAKKNHLRCEISLKNTTVYARKNKLSIETAARALRHAFFAHCAKKHRIRALFLAHHAEDQVETCLFNYLRGAGIAGLAGMRPTSLLSVDRTRLEIVRPLLAISRVSIEEFLKKEGISYRDDASNADLGFSRNRIRHRVLGYLEKSLGRDVRKSILRTADILAAEEEWMQEETAAFPLSKQLCVKALRALPVALRRRVIRRWLTDEGVPEPDFADVIDTLKLLEKDAKSAKANLPRGIHVRRKEGRMFLEFPRKK